MRACHSWLGLVVGKPWEHQERLLPRCLNFLCRLAVTITAPERRLLNIDSPTSHDGEDALRS